MTFDKKSVVFRRGYYADDIGNNDQNDLIKYQLTPMSPYIYSETDDLICPEDILDATISKDESFGGYCVDIKFSAHAIQIMNELCNLSRYPYIIMFIKGHPFFMILLNGPFETNVLRWDVDELQEAELLKLNLINES